MVVDAVVGEVGLRATEPAKGGRLPVEHLVPLAEPREALGGSLPEGNGVFGCFAAQSVCDRVDCLHGLSPLLGCIDISLSNRNFRQFAFFCVISSEARELVPVHSGGTTILDSSLRCASFRMTDQTYNLAYHLGRIRFVRLLSSHSKGICRRMVCKPLWLQIPGFPPSRE